MYVHHHEILGHTDGGLDIILALYPDASQAVSNKNYKFKTHDEKTASTALFKKTDHNVPGGYVYYVTNFGKSTKGKNAIDCYMEVHGLDFGAACQEIAVQFNVPGADPSKAPKAAYSDRPATTEEPEGAKTYELKTSFSDKDIETLLPRYVLANIGWTSGEEKKKEAYTKIATAFKKYNFYNVESYTIVKNRKAMTFTSTEDYPIFAWIEQHADKVDFVKLYQPKHADKGRRFMYISTKKPKDFMHGYAQAEREYLDNKEIAYDEIAEGSYETQEEAEKAALERIKKLPGLFIMSGGSDALSLAVLGYWVVWPNSETAELTHDHMYNYSLWSHKVYQLYDIDSTGVSQAHENALKHLDLYTIELPAELLKSTDRRGNPCKDLRDYFGRYRVPAFKDLVRVSLPYRFWDKVPKYSGKGKDRVQIGTSYEFNNVQCYNFLSKNGFYRLKADNLKNGFMFIKIEGNIVREIQPNEVKNYIHSFLKTRQMDNDLRNTMFRTTQLSENSLSNLPFIDLDFNDTGKEHQYIVFENAPIKVTAEGITEYEQGGIDSFVWEQDTINFNYRTAMPAFSIIQDIETRKYDIVIHHYNCLFFNYLIQTSRIHWRDELEVKIKTLPADQREAYKKANQYNISGSLLNEEDQYEQRQHLINKLFAMGYLLHRYKDAERPWCVFAMDNNISDDGGSYGGSGKSILFNKAIPHVLKNYFYLGGRNPRITENQFIYDGLTEHHRYIYIDDADEFLNFKFFFDAITGNLKVNPKNMAPYMIPGEKVGKYAITSNFTLRNIDPSTERRILYTVFSDYYHTMGESNNYMETRTPGADLGKQLFTDFDRTEWNHFYNTMIYSLQFFLSNKSKEKINPPMDNVNMRNMMTEMGADFLEWATEFFYEDGFKVDCLVTREEAFKTFDYRYKKGWKTQKFSNALRAFCKFKGYIYNPSDLITSTSGTPRILHKVDEYEFQKDGTWKHTGRKTAKDMLYIQTHPDKALNTDISKPGVSPSDFPPAIDMQGFN